MPYFLIEYQTSNAGLRSQGDAYKAAQAARKEYGKALGGRLLVAGPKYRAGTDEDAVGSIVILEADSREAAERDAAADPYYQIGELKDLTVNELIITSFNSDFKLSR